MLVQVHNGNISSAVLCCLCSYLNRFHENLTYCESETMKYRKLDHQLFSLFAPNSQKKLAKIDARTHNLQNCI